MTPVALPIDKLLIVSHVCHYAYEGRIHAYGPYAREIDIWADLFAQVSIAAPLRQEAPPDDCISFTRPNIAVIRQLERGGDTLWAKAGLVLSLPFLIAGLYRAMRKADAIHVRCPGNLGLLGTAMAPAFSRFLVAKYAGQWNGYASEPLAVWLQRTFLKSAWWSRGVVTVYGEWPSQPDNIVPFFTSMMTMQEVRRAAGIARHKKLQQPVEILYAGRLASAKCVHILLQAAARLRAQGMPVRVSVVGDGPERASLERLTNTLGLNPYVQFAGAVPFDRMVDWYERAHILVLPSSHSEGWPKVIAEAMCHGVVCIGTDHGLLPWLLRGRGHVVPVADAEALACCIGRVAGDAEGFLDLSASASAWACQYSLDGLREALSELLSRRWKIQRPTFRTKDPTKNVESSCTSQ
jgi:glycosyltransferase involved in cell wall biosynthesis